MPADMSVYAPEEVEVLPGVAASVRLAKAEGRASQHKYNYSQANGHGTHGAAYTMPQARLSPRQSLGRREGRGWQSGSAWCRRSCRTSPGGPTQSWKADLRALAEAVAAFAPKAGQPGFDLWCAVRSTHGLRPSAKRKSAEMAWPWAACVKIELALWPGRRETRLSNPCTRWVSRKVFLSVKMISYCCNLLVIMEVAISQAGATAHAASLSAARRTSLCRGERPVAAPPPASSIRPSTVPAHHSSVLEAGEADGRDALEPRACTT